MSDIKHLIGAFADLAEPVQQATARFLVEATILQITRKAADGVVETEICYHGHGPHGHRLHKLHYNESAGKLLGGSDPRVIEATLRSVSEAERAAVRAAGTELFALKIKHDKQDAEFIEAVFCTADRQLIKRKFTMDGAAKV